MKWAGFVPKRRRFCQGQCYETQTSRCRGRLDAPIALLSTQRMRNHLVQLIRNGVRRPRARRTRGPALAISRRIR